MMSHGRNVADNIYIGKFRLCKSAEKNCSEAESYYSCPACQTGIIRTGFSATNFRLNRVTRLANTGGY